MQYRKRQKTARSLKIHSPIRCMLIAMVLLFVGCDSMKKHYKKGNRYLEEGRYEEAVRELSEALEKCREKDDEPCDLYIGRLQYAKGRAAEHYYALAQQRFAEKHLDQALKPIDKAIHYAPPEPRYQSYRREILAAIEGAEQLRRQALNLADQGQWDAAIETLQQALGQNRSLSGGNNDLQQIKQRAHDHYLNLAQQQLNQGNWDEAIAQANRALNYDSQSRSAKDVITEVNNRREAKRLIEQAKNLLHTGADPQQVLNILEKARRLHGSHPDLDALTLQARQGLCDQKLERARQALQRKEFHHALDLLQASKRILKSYGNVDALILETRQGLCDEKLEQARQALQGREFHRAIALLHESKRILNNYGNVDGLILEATLDLSDWHRETADHYRERGLPGNALLSYLSAIHYAPEDTLIRQGIAAAVALLRQETQYSVGFVGYRSSWQNRHIAARLDTDTLEYLHQIKPPNVSIVERGPLERILRDVNLHLPDINAVEFRVESGRIKEVDALLMGQILQRKMTTEKATSKGKSTYRSGARLAPNPAYEQARINVVAAEEKREHAQKKLQAAQKEVSQFPVPPPPDEPPARRKRRREAMQRLAQAEKQVVKARKALEKAKEILVQTPRRIRVPKLIEYHYPITHVTKTASLVCFLKVVDSITGEILLAEEITGQYSATDQAIVGDIIHNVPNDPLTIPGDDYLTDQAVIAASDKLHYSIHHVLQEHGRRFVILQRNAASTGDEETAVENSMKYLFAHPIAVKDTKKMLTYLQQIAQKRNQGIRVDLKPIVQQYGSVLLQRGRLPGDLQETEAGLTITSLRNTRLPRGLRLPCRLRAVEGVSVHSLAELDTILSYHGAAEEVTLTLVSQNQHFSVDVKLIPGTP